MPVFIGAGTVFSRGDGASPEVFTVIGEVVNLVGPGAVKDEVEVTNLGSSAKEFVSALVDFGEVTAELNWNPQDSEHVLLRSDQEGSAKVNYRVIWADVSSTQVDFNGEVMEFSISTEPNDAVKASVRIKLSGALTWS